MRQELQEGKGGASLVSKALVIGAREAEIKEMLQSLKTINNLKESIEGATLEGKILEFLSLIN